MRQQDLFSGERLADAAIEQVKESADGHWYLAAIYAVKKLAHSCREFTTDDVWPRLDKEETHERRALGAVMREAVERGWIKATDVHRKSRRPACHARPVRVWASLITQETEELK